VLLPEALDLRLLLGDHPGEDVFQILGRGEGAMSPAPAGAAHVLPAAALCRGDSTGAALTVAALA